jgi:Recombination endonuclease VII
MICMKCDVERGDEFRAGRNICRDCDRARARARYRVKTDEAKAYARAYRRLNAEKVNANNRRYAAENPERYRTWQRRSRRKSKGWEPGRWERMLAEQNGLCAVVGCENEATDADHDHQTQRARAPLCSGCNKALGLLAEDPERLRALADYLERWKQ